MNERPRSCTELSYSISRGFCQSVSEIFCRLRPHPRVFARNGVPRTPRPKRRLSVLPPLPGTAPGTPVPGAFSALPSYLRPFRTPSPRHLPSAPAPVPPVAVPPSAPEGEFLPASPRPALPPSPLCSTRPCRKIFLSPLDKRKKCGIITPNSKATASCGGSPESAFFVFPHGGQRAARCRHAFPRTAENRIRPAAPGFSAAARHTPDKKKAMASSDEITSGGAVSFCGRQPRPAPPHPSAPCRKEAFS